LAQGFTRFYKQMIFGTLDPNAKVAHEVIDLSSLPDGFDEEVTMKWYISLLAMGFGADFQDFAPLPGGGLGSSQQSQILHQKSKGKGPALFMKILEHKFNFHGVMPRNVTFRYDEQDIAGDMEQATLSKMRADTAAVYVMNGVLTPEAVRQQMLDRGELTQEEFDTLQIEPDVTPDVVANDTDPVDNLKAIRKPDFMGRERRKAEADFQIELQKAFNASLAEFKKRILGNKKTKETLPFDDVINDEELWEDFRVRVVGAAQPYFRTGALQAAEYNAGLGLAVNMDLVNQSVLDFTRTYTNQWWAELAETTREGLRKSILNWQTGKLPGQQGLQDLVDSITPLFGEARARRIAITETTRIFDEGNRLAHISAGIKYEQWQTAEDEFTCPTCSVLNDQYFPTESGPRPVTDSHPNCLLPNVRVNASHLIAGSRAFYRGNAIEITTENGNVLTCTPNHPILTPLGFVKAKNLNERDYVIRSLDSERMISSIDPNNNNSPAPIEDIWNSLRMKNGMLLRSMPVTAHDFHGDARSFNGDINIIYSDGFLLSDIINSLVSKHFNKDFFTFGDMSLSRFAGQGVKYSCGDRSMASFTSNMRSGSSRLALLDSHLRHRYGISLASIAGSDPSFKDSTSNRIPSNAIFTRQSKLRSSSDVFRNQSIGNRNATVKSGNLATIKQPVKSLRAYSPLASQILHTFAGLISPDKIIRIRNYNFNGHVYDLQSLEQVYIGSNIIVKNCRCQRLPAANYNPVE
jgi:hypothetical protein